VGGDDFRHVNRDGDLQALTSAAAPAVAALHFSAASLPSFAPGPMAFHWLKGFQRFVADKHFRDSRRWNCRGAPRYS
jgi:hypothetical protein